MSEVVFCPPTTNVAHPWSIAMLPQVWKIHY